MSDFGAYACPDCGGTLRLFFDNVMRCRNASHGGDRGCGNRKRVKPTGPRPRVVEVFVCSCGCGREERVRHGDPRPERVCEHGGMLVYDRTLTR